MIAIYELFEAANANTVAASAVDIIDTGEYADRGRADGWLNLHGNMALLEDEQQQPPPEQPEGCIYVAY